MGLESEALRGFREMELRRRLRVFLKDSGRSSNLPVAIYGTTSNIP